MCVLGVSYMCVLRVSYMCVLGVSYMCVLGVSYMCVLEVSILPLFLRFMNFGPLGILFFILFFYWEKII